MALVRRRFRIQQQENDEQRQQERQEQKKKWYRQRHCTCTVMSAATAAGVSNCHTVLFVFVLVVLFVLVGLVDGAIQNMNGITLLPNSNRIVYDIGYIRNGGTIDMSDLLFETQSILLVPQQQQQQENTDDTTDDTTDTDTDSMMNIATAIGGDDDDYYHTGTGTSSSSSSSREGSTYTNTAITTATTILNSIGLGIGTTDTNTDTDTDTGDNDDEEVDNVDNDDDEIHDSIEYKRLVLQNNNNNQQQQQQQQQYQTKKKTYIVNLDEDDEFTIDRSIPTSSTNSNNNNGNRKRRNLIKKTSATVTTTTISSTTKDIRNQIINDRINPQQQQPQQKQQQQQQQKQKVTIQKSSSSSNNHRRLLFSSLFSTKTTKDVGTTTTTRTTKTTSKYDTTNNYTIIDIAIVAISNKCSQSLGTTNTVNDHCPWQQLGIGQSFTTTTTTTPGGDDTSTTSFQWCCNDDSIQLFGAGGLGVEGLHCSKQSKNYGRLLINESSFTGQRRSVLLPAISTTTGTTASRTVTSMLFASSSSSSTSTSTLDDNTSPIIQLPNDISSSYMIIYANCGTVSSKTTTTTSETTASRQAKALSNRLVTMQGDVIWKSKHGYLPGELYGFYIYYYIVTIIYTIVLVWFVLQMYQHSSTRVDIEYYITIALVLGLIEMIGRIVDYTIWNTIGERNVTIIWIGIICTVVKESFSHCVLLLVSMGYTVCHNTIQYKQRYIIFGIGLIYVMSTLLVASLLAIATKHIHTLSYRNEIILIDTATIITYIQYSIGLLFLIAVYYSITQTISYLHRIGEVQKLKRTRNLRTILICSSIYLLVCWLSTTQLYKWNIIILNEQYTSWFYNTFTEINYIVVLIGIAILWKPNQHAYDYTYTTLKKHDTNTTTTTTTINSGTSNKSSTTRQLSPTMIGYESDGSIYSTSSSHHTLRHMTDTDDSDEERHNHQHHDLVNRSTSPPQSTLMNGCNVTITTPCTSNIMKKKSIVSTKIPIGRTGLISRTRTTSTDETDTTSSNDHFNNKSKQTKIKN